MLAKPAAFFHVRLKKSPDRSRDRGQSTTHQGLCGLENAPTEEAVPATMHGKGIAYSPASRVVVGSRGHMRATFG